MEQITQRPGRFRAVLAVFSIAVCALGTCPHAFAQKISATGKGEVFVEVPERVVVAPDWTSRVEVKRIGPIKPEQVAAALPSRVLVFETLENGELVAQRSIRPGFPSPEYVLWSSKTGLFEVVNGAWSPMNIQVFDAAVKNTTVPVCYSDPLERALVQARSKQNNLLASGGWTVDYFLDLDVPSGVFSQVEAVAVRVKNRLESMLANNSGHVIIELRDRGGAGFPLGAVAATTYNGTFVPYSNVRTFLSGLAASDNDGSQEETWYDNLPSGFFVYSDSPGFPSGNIFVAPSLKQKWFFAAPDIDATIFINPLALSSGIFLL